MLWTNDIIFSSNHKFCRQTINIFDRNHCGHTFVINKRPEKLYNEYGNMLNNGQPSEKSHDQDKQLHSALSFD